MKSVLVVLALGMMGCASFQNTPAQDRTWAALDACKAEQRVPGNIQMQRVEPDGRYWYQWVGSPYGTTDFTNCMREQFAKQRAQ